MSDDIGAWYDRQYQRALQLQGELNAEQANLRTLPVRSQEFRDAVKRIAILKAQLEQARYVGD